MASEMQRGRYRSSGKSRPGYASAPTAAAATATGSLLGTPLYMAPEMGLKSAVDSAVDVFAFGIVAYEMLTKKTPCTVKARGPHPS